MLLTSLLRAPVWIGAVADSSHWRHVVVRTRALFANQIRILKKKIKKCEIQSLSWVNTRDIDARVKKRFEKLKKDLNLA